MELTCVTSERLIGTQRLMTHGDTTINGASVVLLRVTRTSTRIADNAVTVVSTCTKYSLLRSVTAMWLVERFAHVVTAVLKVALRCSRRRELIVFLYPAINFALRAAGEGGTTGIFGSTAVVLRSGRSYEAGEEFLISYGPKGAAGYLEENGCVLDYHCLYVVYSVDQVDHGHRIQQFH